MGTKFKSPDNNELKELCHSNSCENVVFVHKLTSKFYPLDICVNKSTKHFFFWKVQLLDGTCSQDLKAEKPAGNVNVSIHF